MAGCAQQLAVEPSTQRVFELLAGSTGVSMIDCADQVAPLGSEWLWQRMDSDGRALRDAPIRACAAATSQYGAQWMVPMISGDREFFVHTHANTIGLTAVEAPSDRAISTFTPPLGIAVGPLHLGDEVVTTSTMRIEWIDSRGERDHGIGERTARFVTCARVRTPLGVFDTAQVETRFLARLQFAHVQRTGTVWVVPGIGPIAETWREFVRVFGVLISDESGAAVRVSQILLAPPTPLP
ncbi:MAG: hypothetical protein EXS15_06360 [Phycisphaerales bacterium]|nr:hypothetical protein [Phycisphaerales bacterium]